MRGHTERKSARIRPPGERAAERTAERQPIISEAVTRLLKALGARNGERVHNPKR
jgi:hypothetical protein